jgi:hypothetical protein
VILLPSQSSTFQDAAVLTQFFEALNIHCTMASREGDDNAAGVSPSKLDDAELATAHHTEATPAPELAPEARRGADSEHRMTLLQAIKMYPKAVGWSVLLSSTLIMEGYDLALVGNLYASPMFNQKYGVFNEATGKYVISAAWQSGISNGARAGEIFGLIIAGWTADRYGYKMTTIGALLFLMASIFTLFFAQNIVTLVAGCVLCGMYSSPFPQASCESLLTILQVFHGEYSKAPRQHTPPKSHPRCFDRT